MFISPIVFGETAWPVATGAAHVRGIYRAVANFGSGTGVSLVHALRSLLLT